MVHYLFIFFFSYKVECSVGISTTEKNCITTGGKLRGGRQSTADMPLALFSTMNGWQHILFLKSELSELLLVSKMFIQ